MPKTAQHKLTSEERCRKAFRQWAELLPLETYADGTFRAKNTGWTWQGWQACWKYLQSHLEEYVKS